MSARNKNKAVLSRALETLESRRLLATFVVTNSNDSGANSLRWAIDQSNGVAGADAIHFNISGADKVIDLSTALPTVTGRVTIDGLTQPGASQTPVIRINGLFSFLSANNAGLEINAPLTEVRGLSWTGFSGTAPGPIPGTSVVIGKPIRVNAAANGVLIEKNFFGVQPDGTATRNGGGDVEVFGINAMVRDNVFAGGSFAGLDNGQFLPGSPGARSLLIDGDGAIVRGNRFNVNLAGNAQIASMVGDTTAIRVTANNATIGGVNAGDSNYISGFGSGIVLDEVNTAGIRGNYFGTDTAGLNAIGHNQTHVLSMDSVAITVGGTDRGNVFGPAGTSVEAYRGNTLTVRNNLIGINAAGGRIDLPPNVPASEYSSYGVVLNSVVLGTIADNSIGNQYGTGIYLAQSYSGGFGSSTPDGETDSIAVEGNAIGTLKSNQSLHHPNGTGIRVHEATRVSIGGFNSAANVIRYNTGSGIVISKGEQNPVRVNVIADNGGLEVDLKNDGPTANDVSDADTGPNGLQNFPYLGGYQMISSSLLQLNFGIVPWVGGGEYRVDFYSSPQMDVSGRGEARTWLGSKTLLSPLGQNANSTFVIDKNEVSGQYISAIATKIVGGELSDSSEISDVFAVPNFAPPHVVASEFKYETGHSLAFKFDKSVANSIDGSDISVVQDGTGTTFPISSIYYDYNTNTVEFSFDVPLPDGNYHATLLPAGVTDDLGQPLQVASSVAFFVLAGDTNRDRTVNFDDLLKLAQNYGGTNKVFSHGDSNYDGKVNFDDLLLLAQRYGTSVFASTPIATPVSKVRSTSREVLN